MLANLLLFLCGLCPQNSYLDNASVSFEIDHLGVLKVEGTMTAIKGTIVKKNKDEWLIVGSIDVKSIDTRNKTRDETLLGEQYLNAEDYPSIPFETKIKMIDGIKVIEIDLELRGISFRLEGELVEKGGTLQSNPISFKRSDIGLDFGLMDSIIGDEITVAIDTGAKSWPH